MRKSVMRLQTIALLGILVTAFTGHAQITGKFQADDSVQIPEKEAVVKLDPKDPGFDKWKELRKLTASEKTTLLNVQRLAGGYPWVGIPTFFHLPVALHKDALKANHVEVAIMGAELVGDARARTWGPAEMRNPHRSEVYHVWGNAAMPELDTGFAALNLLNVVDYGDAPIAPFSLERSMREIRAMVRDIASTKITAQMIPDEQGNPPKGTPIERTIPIIIGGAHALMYPDAAGIIDAYDPERKGLVGVIHFDAHADYSGSGFGHLVTHGNPVRRLLDTRVEDVVDGQNKGPLIPDAQNIIQIGLRGPTSIDLTTLQEGREVGLRYYMMAEIEERGWKAVMEDVLAAVQAAPAQYWFISFDIDVVDPTYIPGTSTPEPGGLTIRETLPLVRRLCAESNLVGFELVELRPDSDPGYTTMLHSKAILRQCLNGLAIRKMIPEAQRKNYRHPWMLADTHRPTGKPK